MQGWGKGGGTWGEASAFIGPLHVLITSFMGAFLDHEQTRLKGMVPVLQRSASSFVGADVEAHERRWLGRMRRCAVRCLHCGCIRAREEEVRCG